MNIKAQTLGMGIIVAIFIFIIGMVCVNFLKSEVTTARTNLNCEDTANISDGTKLTCLAVDITVFYWIIIILSIAGGIITARMKL